MEFKIGDRVKSMTIKGKEVKGTVITVFKDTCHVEWDIKTTPGTDVIKQGSVIIHGRSEGRKYSKVIRKESLEKDGEQNGK